MPFIKNEEINQGRIHIEARIDAMLVHLKPYGDRFFGNGSYMFNKIKEDIAGFDTRSWKATQQLQAECCDQFL